MTRRKKIEFKDLRTPPIKGQGVEGGQALRRAQHLTNPSEGARTVRDANTVNSLIIIIDNRTIFSEQIALYAPCTCTYCGTGYRDRD